MKTRGQDSIERQRFVEDTIGELLEKKQDFAFIKYAKKHDTENEYMRIGDFQGRTATFNITGMSCGEIIDEIARILILPHEKITPPASLVSDSRQLRSISSIF